MYTIGFLCKNFNIARSTLLYYDKIHLLSPSARTEAKYRLYSDTDVEMLKMILMYRQAGVSLEDIKKLISSTSQPILEERLKDLQREMIELKLQQDIVLDMLKGDETSKSFSYFDRGRFSALLTTIGFNPEEKEEFHYKLENMSPAEHQSFLEFLGTPQEEIEKIRSHYRKLDV